MRNTSHTRRSDREIARALFLVPFLMWGAVGCSPARPTEAEERVRFIYYTEEDDSAPVEREELVDRMRKLSTWERQNEVYWLALNMYHEARGEDWDGWLAVGLVTLNRVKSDRYPDTVAAVVTQQNARGCQFSWYCDGLSDAIDYGDETLFREMQVLAEELLLQEAYDDITLGALHYYNARKANPRWAWGKVPSAQIGSHLFFNNVS
ncbi:MAG: cell wall hydrolase [Patescibacteria group bacterium]